MGLDVMQAIQLHGIAGGILVFDLDKMPSGKGL